MRTKKLAIITTTVLLAFTLAGCTAGAKISPPKDTPKPTPSVEVPVTPTPKPTQPIAIDENTTIVLGAQELRILKNGQETTQSLSYDSTPQEVMDTLTPIFGEEPTNTFSQEDEICWWRMSTISWGELNFSFPEQDLNYKEGLVFVSNSTKDDNKVIVQSPNGGVVGGSYAELRKITPEKLTQHYEYEGISYNFLMDEHLGNFPETEEDLYNLEGSMVYAENDVITTLSAPGYLYGDC